MRVIRLSGIAKNFPPSPKDNVEPSHYREITYQADEMPELLLGKPTTNLEELTATIAKQRRQGYDDFYWDQPDEAEQAAVPGLVWVVRYVDMRNARADFQSCLASAAGGPPLLPARMAAKGDSGLFAWIETEDDIDRVVVAGNGKIHLTRLLGGVNSLDWGYEGCQAQLLRWYGDWLVVVSVERGTYVRSIAPSSGEEVGFWLSGRSRSWLIDEDLLLWTNNERGLVQLTALPSLQLLLPIPFCQTANISNEQIQLKMLADGRLGIYDSRPAHFHSADSCIATLTLPSSRQRAGLLETAGPTDELLDVVDANLFPDFRASWPARFLLETFSYPFLREAITEPAWGPRPTWLPIYWHHHLITTGRNSEANELCNWLDHIAATLDANALSIGWQPEWDSRRARISFAILHVQHTCRMVAEALRSGRLPAGTYCLLFNPSPGSQINGSRVDPSRFPPAVRQAFEELRNSNSATLRLF